MKRLKKILPFVHGNMESPKLANEAKKKIKSEYKFKLATVQDWKFKYNFL